MDRKLLATLGVVAAATLLGALLGEPLWGALVGLAIAHLRLLWVHDVPPATPLPPRRSRPRHRQLAESAQLLKRLREMATVLPEAVLLLDTAGRITWANPRAASLLGIEDAGDRGRYLVHLVRSPALAALLERPVPGRVEHLQLDEWIRPGRVLELRAVTGSRGTLVLARDTTEERRVADMRKAFVADVSHELYTPLTVISSSLEALWDEEQEHCRPRARLIGQMRIQAERMFCLVSDLLNLSRLEARTIQREPVDVPAMLQQLVAELRHALPRSPRGVELQVDKCLHYEGDQAALRSVFSNLLRNALQHTPADGRVTLRWYECAEGVRFEVEDTGIGIQACHFAAPGGAILPG